MNRSTESEVRVPVKSQGEPVALLIGKTEGRACTVALIDPAPESGAEFAPEHDIILIPETKFNPQSRKERRWLIKEVRERLADDDVREEEVKEAVYELCARLIEKIGERPQPRSAPEQEEADEAWMAEAQEVLRDPDLLGRILRLLERKGYVRDEITKKVLLYTCLSAYTEEPQNLFLKGPSSSGKSYGATQVAKLFPKDDVWLIGRMSPTALIHSKGEYDESGHIIVNLRGKILIFLENAQKETLEMLLPILSHDSEEIAYKITDKNAKGALKTKEVIIRGFPVAIFCSSRVKLFDDIKTRSMLLTPEMTPEKTLEANIAYARRFMGFNNDKEDEEERKVKAALKLLAKEGGKVLIPYAEALAKVFPQDSHEEMRNFKKLLSLIYLNAFLHKYQRPRLQVGKEEFILATEADYREAVKVFDEIAPATRSGVPDYVAEFYEKVLAAIPVDEDRFSRNIIRKHTEVFGRPLGYSTYREYIHLLEDAGWIYKDDHPEDKRKKVIILNRNNSGKLLQNAPSKFKEIFTEKDFESWLNSIRKNIVEKPGVPCVITINGTPHSAAIFFREPSEQDTDGIWADSGGNLLRAIRSNFRRETEGEEHESSEITRRHKTSLRVTDEEIEAALGVLQSVTWDGWEVSTAELMSAVRHLAKVRGVPEARLLEILTDAGLRFEEGIARAPEDVLARLVGLRKQDAANPGGDAG